MPGDSAISHKALMLPNTIIAITNMFTYSVVQNTSVQIIESIIQIMELVELGPASTNEKVPHSTGNIRVSGYYTVLLSASMD